MQNKVLVVDGDTRSLRLLEVSLKEAGYTVWTATSGRSALEALLAEVPDLVLADTQLGEVDGFTLFERLQQRPEWAHLPFIFILDGDNPAEKLRAVQLGANDFLTRPVFLKEALSRVELLLEKHAQRGESGQGLPIGRARFAGSLSGTALLDLLQTMELGRKSGIATCVSGRGQRALLYFTDGAVVDAELGSLRGESALYRVLTFPSGEYRVELGPVERTCRIELGTAGLLLEAMRRVEEWNRLCAALPPLHTALSAVPIGGAAGALTPESLPGALREVLARFDGQRSILDVLDRCDEESPPRDVLAGLSAVAKLYAARLLTPAGRPISGEPRARVPTPIAVPRLVQPVSRPTPPPIPVPISLPRLTPAPLSRGAASDSSPAVAPLSLPRVSPAAAMTDEQHTPLPPPSPFPLASSTLSAEVPPLMASLQAAARRTPPPIPAIAAQARSTPPPLPGEPRLASGSDAERAALELSSPGHNLTRLAQRLAATRQPLPFTPPSLPSFTPTAFSVVPGSSQPLSVLATTGGTSSQAVVSAGISWSGSAPNPEPISIPEFELTVEHSAPSVYPSGASDSPAVTSPVKLEQTLPLQLRAPHRAAADDAAVHLRAPALPPEENASTGLLPIEVEEVAEPAARPAPPPVPRAPRRRLGQVATWLVAGAALFGLGVGLSWMRQEPDRGPVTGQKPPPREAPAASVAPVSEPKAATPPAATEQPPAAPTAAEAPPTPAAPAAPAAPTAEQAAPPPPTDTNAAPPPAEAEAPVAASTDEPFSALIAKARAAERRGALQAAAHAVHAAQRLQPRRAEVFALLAQLAIDEGNADQAASLAKRALAADRHNADAYLVLGTVEQARAHVAKARAYFKKYLSLAPTGDRAHDVRAVLRLHR